MNRTFYVISVLLTILPLVAQAPSAIKVWKTADLKSMGDALKTRLDAHHLASQSLGTLEGESALVVRREGPGEAEWHDNSADLMFVQSGECSITLGGTITDGHSTGPGETRGTTIEGGQSYTIAAGDVVHVPPKTPHQVVIPAGGQITYFIVKLPAK